MMLQESVLESSNILSGRIRATIVAKSVFLDSASPDGESLLQFGMLPRGDTSRPRARMVSALISSFLERTSACTLAPRHVDSSFAT
jgi:hypothetical protein